MPPYCCWWYRLTPCAPALDPDHRKNDDGRAVVPPRFGGLFGSHPLFERKSDYCAHGVPPVSPTVFTGIGAQSGEHEIAVASMCFSHLVQKRRATASRALPCSVDSPICTRGRNQPGKTAATPMGSAGKTAQRFSLLAVIFCTGHGRIPELHFPSRSSAFDVRVG